MPAAFIAEADVSAAASLLGDPSVAILTIDLATPAKLLDAVIAAVIALIPRFMNVLPAVYAIAFTWAKIVGKVAAVTTVGATTCTVPVAKLYIVISMDPSTGSAAKAAA